MINIAPGAILSVITSTGEDCDVVVSYREVGLGNRGPAKAKYTNITTAVATPGTTILGAPESATHGFEVNGINIRNKGTGANVLTVLITSAVDQATTTVEVYEASVGADQELTYEPGVGWSIETHNTIGEWSTYTVAADVLNTANDVLADVTGLSAPVLAGNVYEFHAFIAYTADATTTGSRWTVNGPAATWLAYDSRYSLTATTETVNHATAYQIPAAANASSATTTGNMAEIHGFVKPSANGTLAIQNAAENTGAANDITALAGSTLRIRRVL